MSETRRDILWRVWAVYILLCLFSLAIVSQVVRIKIVQGEYWKQKADSLMLKAMNIEPLRGNIYSSDGSLLATSTPIYELRIDARAPLFKGNLFNEKIDSLSTGLSKIFNDRAAAEYKLMLRKARKEGQGYFLLKKQATYQQYKKVQELPLFNNGRYKSGLIVIANSKRDRIFYRLAERSIGYKNQNMKEGVGIEGAFDSVLAGVSGKRLMKRVAFGVYKPVNDENEIEPQDGMDLVTTIDMNIQDVAENALYKQLSRHGASKGCVVLMEVKTGEIKAIANLERNNKGEYHETYNYAVGSATEPGSTFKLASIIAAMEDHQVDLYDTVDCSGGIFNYKGMPIKDAHAGLGKISVKRAFELSSNVAFAKLITQYYSKNEKQFVDRLRKMHLHEPTGIKLSGEPVPLIKYPGQKNWWRTTLPVMSYGYETQITPLQMLTFYNAIANNGVMMQPMIVKEVRNKGNTMTKFNPEIISDSICSAKTAALARTMLEGVVLNGTATNLKFDTYSVAGKTGTSKMISKNGRYDTLYQASFCGYFPADQPLYSCIVVIYELSPRFYYGNVVAGPVFKEIADKVYSTQVEMHHELETDTNASFLKPVAKNGRASSTSKALLAVNAKQALPEADWIISSAGKREVSYSELKRKPGTVPDVRGMGLRDAISLLELNGLTVQVIGKGAVVKQSLNAGIPVAKGQLIIIELS